MVPPVLNAVYDVGQVPLVGSVVGAVRLSWTVKVVRRTSEQRGVVLRPMEVLLGRVPVSLYFFTNLLRGVSFDRVEASLLLGFLLLSLFRFFPYLVQMTGRPDRNGNRYGNGRVS